MAALRWLVVEPVLLLGYRKKASFKSRTENHVLSLGQQSIKVENHRMNVLDNVVDGPILINIHQSEAI